MIKQLSTRMSVRLGMLSAIAFGFCIGSQEINAAIVVAGELVADLRARSLSDASTTWTNEDTTGDTVGNFSTVGGGNLNVGSIGGVNKALYVPTNLNDAVMSATQTPASIEGNNTRSVEAWIYALSQPSGSTPVGWGAAGNDQLSSFRWTDASNGMFSGWFNDGAWTDPVILNAWTHVAWTYDGDILNGYVNGVLAGSYDTGDANSSSQDLDTTHNLLVVGGARDGGTDPFDGYIADVRVHTGALSANDVLNNFNEGISIPEPSSLLLFGLCLAGTVAARRR